MVGIQLYIEGELVEMFKDESLTLTQTLQDVLDISKIFADFSRTFNVPTSKQNNKIFKHFYDFHIDGFDSRIKKDAEIYLNYKLFRKGKIKLEGSTLRNNKGYTYKLTFYGNTVNIKDVIGTDTLGVLPFLSAQDLQFDYNSTNVINYLKDGKDIFIGETIEKAVVVPLITHTDRLYYDTSEDTAGTFNLSPGSAVKGVFYDQLKPALRIHTIIKAIEQYYSKSNYPDRVDKSIKFSTDFFNVDNKRYYDLYMWLHKKKGGVAEDGEPSTGMITSISVTGGSEDRRGLGVAGDSLSLTAGGDVAQKTKRTLELKIDTTSTDYNFIVKKDNEIFHQLEGLSGSQTVMAFTDYEDIGGGTFQFYVSSNTASIYTMRGTLREVRSNGISRFVTFAGTTTVTNEFKFIVGEQIPNIGVLDFLSGLFKMFNLTAYYNDLTNEIQVLPLDSFYALSTKSYDITEHIDKESSQVDSLLPYKEIDFKYQGLDTFFAIDHLDRFNKGWGTERYHNGNKFDGEVYSVELPFEHHKFERLRNGFTPTSAQWGWSVDKDNNSVLGKPLLFYPINNTGNNISVMKTTSTKESVANYYIPSNSLELTDSANINFFSEFNEYSGKVFKNTLYYDYYKTYIEQTFDPKRRLTTFKAYLPLSVILNLKLNDLVIVFDTVYTINKITTNFETGLSSLELINKSKDLNVKADLSDEARRADNTTVTADNTIILASNGIFDL